MEKYSGTGEGAVGFADCNKLMLQPSSLPLPLNETKKYRCEEDAGPKSSIEHGRSLVAAGRIELPTYGL
jgi:hypothetical protein